MWDTEQRVEIGDNIAHQGPAGIGIDEIEETKFAEVLEKDGCYCCSKAATTLNFPLYNPSVTTPLQQ